MSLTSQILCSSNEIALSGYLRAPSREVEVSFDHLTLDLALYHQTLCLGSFCVRSTFFWSKGGHRVYNYRWCVVCIRIMQSQKQYTHMFLLYFKLPFYSLHQKKVYTFVKLTTQNWGGFAANVYFFLVETVTNPWRIYRNFIGYWNWVTY